MSFSHLFRLGKLSPQKVCSGGSRISATKNNFSMLHGMSCYLLTLKPQAVREPHWHANADELGYVIQGKVLVSLYGNKNEKSTFVVDEKEAFIVPSGTLHAIENLSEKTAELVLQFSHHEPEDFGLSSVVGMFSNSVLGNTWNVPKETFDCLKHPDKEVFIAERKEPISIAKEEYYSSPYHYSLRATSPLFDNDAGSLRVARQDVWPMLKHQALYSLELKGAGMREPHWHPETAEMGYVHQGKGRMSILSPSGIVDTYEMEPGDLYFIPKAYPHHIENLTEKPLSLLIFFDRAMPKDIGFTGSIKSYSDETLAAIFKTPKELFSSLPTYYEDLLVVKKINSLD